jgi:hypothetical protein
MQLQDQQRKKSIYTYFISKLEVDAGLFQWNRRTPDIIKYSLTNSKAEVDKIIMNFYFVMNSEAAYLIPLIIT